MSIILGLDPWTATVWYGLLSFEAARAPEVVDYGVIETPAGMPQADRLVMLADDLSELLSAHPVAFAGIEKLYFQHNQTTAMAVSEARGILLYSLASRGIAFAEYTPLQVKKGICGSGAAEKPQIQAAVTKLLGLAAPPRPDDAADALAIAYLAGLRCLRGL